MPNEITINISAIRDIRATSKEENPNDSSNDNQDLSEPELFDKPCVTKISSGNVPDAYEVILGKKYISDAKAKGETVVNCYLIGIEYLPISSIDRSNFEDYPHINDEQLQCEVDALKNNGILPPVIIVRPAPNKVLLASGIRRLRVGQTKGLQTIPALELPLTSEQIQSSIRLEFLHEFGEFGVLKHPAVQADYQQMKKEFIPKPKYHDSLKSETAWLSEVKIWVKKSLEEIIKEQITIQNQPQLTDFFLQKIINDENFDKFISKLTNLIGREHFLISDFKQLTGKISSYVIFVLKKLLKYNFESIAKIIKPQLFKEYKSITLEVDDPVLKDQIDKARWFLNDSDIQQQLYNFLKENKFIYINAPKAGTLKKTEIEKATDFFILDITKEDLDESKFEMFFEMIKVNIISPILKVLKENPGVTHDKLIEEKDIKDGMYKVISKWFYEVLDFCLSSFQKEVFDGFSENPSSCTEVEVKKIVDEKYLLKRQFEFVFSAEDYKLKFDKVQEFLGRISVSYLMELQKGHNIAKKHLTDFIAKFEFEVKLSKDLSSQLEKLMLQKRKTTIPEYSYLSSNFCYPFLDTTSKVIAALRLTECSNKRYLKEKAVEKGIFFKPRVKFVVLCKFLFDNPKGSKIVEDSDGLTKFIRSYSLTYGIVTERVSVSRNGLFTILNLQLSTYEKEYKRLIETVKGNLTEEPTSSHKNIASWMLEITKNGGAFEFSSIFSKKHQQRILDHLKSLTFCLFFTEAIRNPGAFVCHAMMLMKIVNESLPKEITTPIEHALIDKGFTMTPSKSTSAARIIQNKLVPKSYFFYDDRKNDVTMKIHVMKTLTGCSTASIDLEDRELTTIKEDHFIALADTTCKVYALKFDQILAKESIASNTSSNPQVKTNPDDTKSKEEQPDNVKPIIPSQQGFTYKK